LLIDKNYKNYKKMKMSRIFFVACLMFIYTFSLAQTVILNVSEETVMTVTGSSTLHDWTSQVDTIRGAVEVGVKMLKKGKAKKGDEIASVNIVVPVKSIISPRGSTMDKKTYNALKSEEHPEIIFALNKNTISSIVGDTLHISASGNLTIAGKTKAVQFPVKGKIISSDKMSFLGAYKLNMVDYDVEPPSAMFGQIVTGEEVEIKFELIVSK
jgi:hypothetical protein